MFVKKPFIKIVKPPFTAGPRMCIGNRFALTEMKIAAAMTLKSFRYKFNFSMFLKGPDLHVSSSRILDSPVTQMNKHPWCYIMLSHDDILIELEKRS